MQVETFQYNNTDASWSIQSFPDLDSENTLVLIFASPVFFNNPKPILELAKQYPKSIIMGCSTAGEIVGAYIYDNSLSVAIIKFAKTRLKLTSQLVPSVEASYQVGKDLISYLDEDKLRGVFVLSEGLNINGSELVRGLNSSNKKDITITGGLAADGSEFTNTWIILNNKILTNCASAVGFYGDNVQIGHGSRGGWDVFGPERIITRSKNNVLYELDHRPALTLYKEYLGDKASGLPVTGLLFPLSIRSSSSNKKYLVRTILAVDESTNSLTFAGDMPMGYFAQLMRANFERLIHGASEASQMAFKSDAKKQDNKKPCLIIAISCVGRRLVLGERAEEETELTLASFPKDSQQIGYYSYGEISPFTSGPCDLHNQTMTITSIMEDS